MADGDPIKRSDFATDDGLKAPLDFAKNTDEAVKSNKELIATIEKLQKTISDNKTSVSQLSKTTNDLLAKNKQLEDALSGVNKGLKEKKDSAKNTSSALHELDEALEGNITRVNKLGERLVTLAKSPIVLFLVTLVATLKLVQTQLSSYYKTTLEGEEIAHRNQAAWDAFGKSAKTAWGNFGKAASDAIESLGGVKGILTGILNYFSPAFAAFYNWRATQAEAVADLESKLLIEHAKHVTEDAQSEIRVNKLLEESRDKLEISAEDRLKAIRGARDAIKKQTQDARELADLEVKAQEDKIKYLGGVVVAGKLISDYTEEEIKKLKVESGEIKKLADAQARRLKIESDGYAKLTSLHKVEKATFDEIEKDKLAQIQHSFDTVRNEGERYITSVTLQAQQKIADLEDAFSSGRKEFTFWDANEFNKEKGSLGDFVTVSIKNIKEYNKAKKDVVQRTNDEIRLAQLDFFDKQINDQITAEIKSIELLEISNDEKFKLIQTLEEKRTKLIQDSANVRGQIVADEFKGIATEQEKINTAMGNLQKQGAQTAIDITRDQFDRQDILYKAHVDKLGKQMDAEVRLAGDNKEAVRAIENKYSKQIADSERKAADSKRREAIFEKSLAVTKIGIQTTLRAFEALATGNVILAGIITSTGILAAASVVAKPIPAYEKGVQGAPGGPAIVGEKGGELMRLPSGEEFLTPGRPTLVDVAPGTDILTHQETLNLLAKRSLAAATTTDRPMVGDDKMDKLIKVVRDKPVTKTGLTKAEFEEVLWRTKAFDNLYR